MFKSLSLLLLLAVVNCQVGINPQLDVVVQSLFPSKFPNGGSVVNNNPSKPVTPIKKENSGKVGISCAMEDGTIGVCVNYYLCDENKNVREDGATIIDIRVFDGICTSYLEVCCLLRDVQPTIKPAKIPEIGCGWRNPEGADMKTTGETTGETKFGEFPWMVAVLKIQTFTQSLGGGSLIAHNVVLTAAHIASSDPQIIRAGEWDTQTENEIYPHQDREIASMKIHKDFIRKNLIYDVALLFLSEPVDLARNVGVACLPPPQMITPGGTECFATGWGKDKFGKEGHYQVILKKVEVPAVKRDACQTALRRTRLGRFFKLHSSFMCAGGEEGKDTCKGDGGSPLSCPIPYQEGRYMQSGIVAWGIGCGGAGIPGVYVDVASMREWIDQQMVSEGLDTRSYTF